MGVCEGREGPGATGAIGPAHWSPRLITTQPKQKKILKQPKQESLSATSMLGQARDEIQKEHKSII